MSVTLTVRDETAAGQTYHEVPLEFPSERITIRELIRARIYQEVQDFNREQNSQVFRGLVQPSDTERQLNGQRPEFHLKKPRTIDWKEQFEQAQQAFANNGFLVLVGDQQAESLDEEVVINAGTQIAFVKLTLLVGG